jgi:hypothetical protein
MFLDTVCEPWLIGKMGGCILENLCSAIGWKVWIILFTTASRTVQDMTQSDVRRVPQPRTHFSGKLVEEGLKLFSVPPRQEGHLGHFQHHTEWIPGTDVLVLKAADGDTNCSAQLSTEVNTFGALFHASFTPSWSGSLPQVCLPCVTIIKQLIILPDCSAHASSHEWSWGHAVSWAANIFSLMLNGRLRTLMVSRYLFRRYTTQSTGLLSRSLQRGKQTLWDVAMCHSKLATPVYRISDNSSLMTSRQCLNKPWNLFLIKLKVGFEVLTAVFMVKRLERLGQLKNPITTSRIVPATFRLSAWTNYAIACSVVMKSSIFWDITPCNYYYFYYYLFDCNLVLARWQ